MPTTPAAPVDFAALFPELAAMRARAVRLNPRRAVGELHPAASKMGGPFLWPANERWPGEAEHDPFVPVLQLRREDVPELAFPEGRDLFQLLWRPRDLDGHGPEVRGAWRTASDVLGLRALPEPHEPQPGLIARACTLEPEAVDELPHPFGLPGELRAAIATWEAQERDGEPVYQYLGSTAPGTKVGGHPGWIQDPETPACPRCGVDASYILTIASAEFDGGSWPRWMCDEERHLWDSGDWRARELVQCGADLMLGDMGSVYVHACYRCEGWPLARVFQCS